MGAVFVVGAVVAFVVGPRLVNRLTRRYTSEVTDYLDEQGGDRSGGRDSWAVAGWSQGF